ncbi:MAG: folate-binding protein YgfZ [Rubrobacteraceae bacterium]|jgi:folate-binding protein YgfZ|nr:folate-binding protein YgfZ [Rubrobacteraceae bacterium]
MGDPETSQLENIPRAGGAEYTRFAGVSVHGDPAAEHAALEGGAAVVDLSHRIILRLAGKDPVGMLNAVLTNDVPKDDSVVGVYAALLNPKGRIQIDLRVLKTYRGVLIDTEPEGAAAAREILGRYAPFSRVTLEDLSHNETAWGILGLYGPQVKGLLGDPDLTEHESAEMTFGDVTVLAAGVAVPVPGYDLIGPRDAIEATLEHLIELGAVPVGLQAYETARIETGIPRFGSDITPENFPAEAGILERAVSFGKGCYPGQETVARMHYRGHPNKTLHRLTVEGPPPPPGAPILQNGKQVGTVTSVAPLPVDERILALGYLHRNTDTQGTLHAKDAIIRPVS